MERQIEAVAGAQWALLIRQALKLPAQAVQVLSSSKYLAPILQLSPVV